MERKRWRVFLDTSALIARIVSPTGAAREVLRLAEARVIELVVSRQVVVEAERNFASKIPLLLDDYHLLLRHLAPVVVKILPMQPRKRPPASFIETMRRFWRRRDCDGRLSCHVEYARLHDRTGAGLGFIPGADTR